MAGCPNQSGWYGISLNTADHDLVSVSQGIQLLSSLPEGHPEIIPPQKLNDLNAVPNLAVMSETHKIWWRNFIQNQFDEDFGMLEFDDFFLLDDPPEETEDSHLSDPEDEPQRLIQCPNHPLALDFKQDDTVVVRRNKQYWLGKVMEVILSDQLLHVEKFRSDEKGKWTPTSVQRWVHFTSILANIKLTARFRLRKTDSTKIQNLLENVTHAPSSTSSTDKSEDSISDRNPTHSASSSSSNSEDSISDQNPTHPTPSTSFESTQPRKLLNRKILYYFQEESSWVPGKVNSFIKDDLYSLTFTDGTFSLSLDPALYRTPDQSDFPNVPGGWSCFKK